MIDVLKVSVKNKMSGNLIIYSELKLMFFYNEYTRSVLEKAGHPGKINSEFETLIEIPLQVPRPQKEDIETILDILREPSQAVLNTKHENSGIAQLCSLCLTVFKIDGCEIEQLPSEEAGRINNKFQ